MRLSLLLLLSFLAQRSLAALAPWQVVENINHVATVSSDANNAISILSPDMPIPDVIAIGQVSELL